MCRREPESPHRDHRQARYEDGLKAALAAVTGDLEGAGCLVRSAEHRWILAVHLPPTGHELRHSRW